MKRIVLLLIATLTYVASFSQIEPVNQTILNKFFKTTTIVVREDIGFGGYNNMMEQSVKALWDLTPTEVISLADFREKKFNEDYSFLILSEARYSKGNVMYKFNMLNLVLGGKAKYLPDMPEVVAIPISFYKEEEDNFTYKLGAIIHLMQCYINYSKDNVDTDISKMVKNYSTGLKGKELWVVQDDLAKEVSTMEQIKKVYPNKIKIATKDEVTKAIETKAENVAIFYRLGPEGKFAGETKCWNFIISAEDGKPLYYRSHKVNSEIPNALTAKDLKKLSKL